MGKHTPYFDRVVDGARDVIRIASEDGGFAYVHAQDVLGWCPLFRTPEEARDREPGKARTGSGPGEEVEP